MFPYTCKFSRTYVKSKMPYENRNPRHEGKNPRWPPFLNIFGFYAESKLRMNSKLFTASCIQWYHIHANFQERRLNLRYRAKIAIYFFSHSRNYSRKKEKKIEKKLFLPLQFFQTSVKLFPLGVLSFDLLKTWG